MDNPRCQTHSQSKYVYFQKLMAGCKALEPGRYTLRNILQYNAYMGANMGNTLKIKNKTNRGKDWIQTRIIHKRKTLRLSKIGHSCKSQNSH